MTGWEATRSTDRAAPATAGAAAPGGVSGNGANRSGASGSGASRTGATSAAAASRPAGPDRTASAATHLPQSASSRPTESDGISERDWLNTNPDPAKRPWAGAGAGAGADPAGVTCNCAEKPAAAQRTTTKPGANQGRMFYACNKRREEQCGFFQWCDEAPTDLPPQRRFESNAFSSGGGGGGGGGGATSRGSCFKCNQTGHFARDCTADSAGGGGRPGATSSTAQYPRSAAPGYNVSRGPSGGTGPGDVPQCGCGIPATSRTVSKEG